VFGYTVGPLAPSAGRDHCPQQFAFFGGGDITGGKTIGTTNPDRSDTVDSVWSQQRYLYPEDIEAITYSAIGVDRTTVRHDALGCGFAYLPTTDRSSPSRSMSSGRRKPRGKFRLQNCDNPRVHARAPCRV
jgi:Protein of unknown function (DUF1501)